MNVRLGPLCPLTCDPPTGSLHPDLCALAQKAVCGPRDISDPVDALARRADAPIILDLQAPLPDDLPDALQGTA